MFPKSKLILGLLLVIALSFLTSTSHSYRFNERRRVAYQFKTPVFKLPVQSYSNPVKNHRIKKPHPPASFVKSRKDGPDDDKQDKPNGWGGWEAESSWEKIPKELKEKINLVNDLVRTLGPQFFLIPFPFILATLPLAIPAIPLSIYLSNVTGTALLPIN